MTDHERAAQDWCRRFYAQISPGHRSTRHWQALEYNTLEHAVAVNWRDFL